MSFVPLQVISSYSLLQSPITVEQLVTTAKKRGYSAIALTDFNVMYGLVNFYNAAHQAGIKPLLGLQLSIAVGDLDNNLLHLVLIAKNNRGYQSLMKLSTRRQTLAANHQLTVDQLTDLLTGLFVILPPQELLTHLGNQAVEKTTAQIKAACDDNALYVGINSPADSVHQQAIKHQADQLQAPLVAVEAVEYLNSDDWFATQVLRAIGSGQQLTNLSTLAQQNGPHFLRSSAEMTQRFQAAGLGEAVEQSQRIADQCQVTLKFQSPVLPHFKTPAGQSSADYLKSLCMAGLKKRSVARGFNKADYQKRLKRELQTIHQMGFDDYFLIVWDVMNFAHRVKITTGPGRGSAAGSLVAYALAITDVDPLKYHLLFERFLNPERQQMPDIDLDIPDNRRGEVLKYVHDKYGHDRVGQIITFGTLAAKQVVRDVSRVFGFSSYEMSQLANAIPGGPKVTLAGALKDSQPLVNLLHDSPKMNLLWKVARRLEGLPRHYSTHAAGVVLSDKPLVETVPLQLGSDGMLMTQFEKGTVEAVGLLKMDFLGLKNLTIMDTAIKLIRRTNPDFSLAQVALDDPKTMTLFQQGKTGGVFQFESAGIRRVLIDLHPENFELIVAVNALYRPGPMENIDHFIARKKGQEKITYPDPSLKPILQPTFGILVYQEQVMQSASAMAGFSLGQADLLRRAMSKKKRATMESMRAKFIDGAVALGHPRAVADQVFDYIDRFANYGFNRSHAVAYSKMAFEMAYLKCHYPAEFFTALFNSETNLNKLRRNFDEAKAAGVKIQGPHINTSQATYSLDHSGTIHCGLTMIKGLRRDFVAAIIQERQAHGPYKDIRDFVSRQEEKWQNEKLIAPLAYVGAFDGLGYNRREMIRALPDLVKGVQLSAGLELFNDDPSFQTVIAHCDEFSLTERLSYEYEYLGLYLSGHPTTSFRDLANRLHATPVDQLRAGQQAVVLVFVGHVKEIHTKKGHRLMAFIDATDATGAVEMTAFPKAYAQYSALLRERSVVVVRGSTENREGRGLQLLINQVASAQELQNRFAPASGQWYLRIDQDHDQAKILQELAACFRAHHGQQPVLIVYTTTDRKILQPPSRYLARGQATKNALVKILGRENVVFRPRSVVKGQ